MTISKDLFLSILSKDAYNRGYNPGIAGLDGTHIGNATIGVSSSINPNSPEVAASFDAAAYTIGSGVTGIAAGTTVILYMGTP